MLCILLKINNLAEHSTFLPIHNIKANLDIIFVICKSLCKDDLDQFDNFYSYRNKTKMSDIQIVTLALTAETLSIDSENLLFIKLKMDYKQNFPNLVDRANYNRRRRRLAFQISSIAGLVLKPIVIDINSSLH